VISNNILADNKNSEENVTISEITHRYWAK